MYDTDFDTLASSLTIRSIASPLGRDIQASHDISSAREAIEYSDAPSRVMGNDGAEGIVWEEDLIKCGVATIRDAMRRLEPTDFVSSDTSILEIIDVFISTGKPYFYLIEKNEVVKILYYSDIFNPIGRLALLALALEIEQAALNLCSMFHLRNQCWGALNENRQNTARKLYEKRSRHPLKKTGDTDKSIKELIGCTAYCDKETMITKSRLVDLNAEDNLVYLGQRPREITTLKCFKEIFQKLENIRNLCAHSGYKYKLVERYPPKELGELVGLAKDLKKKLVEAIKNNRPKELEERGEALLNELLEPAVKTPPDQS